jgi:hypothetical protein
MKHERRNHLKTLGGCLKDLDHLCLYLIKILPRFILVAIYRALYSSKFGEVGGLYHVSQAPDEMNCLAQELEMLVEKSGLSSPAIRKVLSM